MRYSSELRIDDDAIAVRNMRGLKEERMRHGLEQISLAKIIGCPPTTLGYYERGDTSCTVKVYNKLAEYFGWSKYVPRQLSYPQTPSTSEPAIVRNLANLPTIASDAIAVSNIRRLQEERKKRMMTQKEVANIVGASCSAVISNIENGRQVCPVFMYNRLAKYFGWEEYIPNRKEHEANAKVSVAGIMLETSSASKITDDAVAMANLRTLKAEREKRGLSQLDVQHMIGIKYHSTIGFYERMERDCPVDTYNKLAKIFGWEKYVSGRESLSVNGIEKPASKNMEQEVTSTVDILKAEQSPYSVRLPEPLRNDLYTIATIQHTTMSDLIIKLITEYTAPHREIIDAVTAFRNNSKQKESE